MSASLTAIGACPHLAALLRVWKQIPAPLQLPLCVRETTERDWHAAYDTTDRRGHTVADDHTSFATTTDDGRLLVDLRRSRMPGSAFILAHELGHVLWGHHIPQARKDAWSRFYPSYRGPHPSGYRKDSPEEQLCEGLVARYVRPLPPGYHGLGAKFAIALEAVLGS